MLALGIDPGTAITGYGLVRETEEQGLVAVDYGVIRTPAKMPMPKRLVLLYENLEELLQTHSPDSSAVEKLYFQKNVRTAMSVSQARGVTLLALARANLPIAEYTPTEIKQAITGYGAADKKQMQDMVRILLNLDEIPQPDDAADALAVAVCHLQSAKTQALYDQAAEN